MKSASQNILIITNLYPVPWGPNRASFNKQQFDLLAEENKVSIVVLLPWTEWIKHRSECKSTESLKYCPYLYIPKVGRRLVPFFQMLSLLLLLPWMKAKKADSLYSSWGFPDAVAGSMINRWLKLPFFVKVHGTDVNENALYPARRKLIKKWLSKAETIFCASKALGNVLEKSGIDSSKLLVNYNGVNRDLFYPSEGLSNNSNIIFVGSLIPTKGVNELVAAFEDIQKNFPEATLHIVGEGPLKPAIKEITLTRKLNIILHGSIALPMVAEKVRTSTLLVLPSYREGVPNVLLEAFASGVPVVSTSVGGIPEVVNDNVGILVEPENTHQLKVAIVDALKKDWNKQDILQHSYQFDWEKNVECVQNRMKIDAIS
jgi:glycosyltransferase involved in cell wall biosynthesis